VLKSSEHSLKEKMGPDCEQVTLCCSVFHIAMSSAIPQLDRFDRVNGWSVLTSRKGSCGFSVPFLVLPLAMRNFVEIDG